MFKFEWDGQKATSNLLKHCVSFDEAISVFGDALALTFATRYEKDIYKNS